MTTKNIKIIDDTVITNNDNNINYNNDVTDENIINAINNISIGQNTKNITKKHRNKITIDNFDTTPIPKTLNTTDNTNILNQISTVKNISLCEEKINIHNPINEVNTNEKLPKKSNDFFKELLQKQLPNVSPTKKLTYNDIKRISKFLVTSIFDENNCSVWNGYITNEKNQTKGTYINFYFNQKKIALHRLLYLNFIGDILNTEYIKFSCTNKGKCCNINHMKKYSYNSTSVLSDVEEHHVDNSVHIVQNKNDLVIEL